MTWANGRGVTAEICAVRSAADRWDWRVSIADVSDDGPFSVFPGVDRHIAVVQGVGIALSIAGEAEQRVVFGSAALTFAGDVVTTCRLLDGPVLDLNLMVRRGFGVGALLINHVPAGHSPTVDTLGGSHPHVAAIVVVQGLVHVESLSLTPFDALLIDAGERLPDLEAATDSIIAVVTLQMKSGT